MARKVIGHTDTHTQVNVQTERVEKVRSHLGLALGLHRINVNDLHACTGPERPPCRHVRNVEKMVAGSGQPEGQIGGRTRHEGHRYGDWASEVAG